MHVSDLKFLKDNSIIMCFEVATPLASSAVPFVERRRCHGAPGAIYSMVAESEAHETVAPQFTGSRPALANDRWLRSPLECLNINFSAQAP